MSDSLFDKFDPDKTGDGYDASAPSAPAQDSGQTAPAPQKSASLFDQFDPDKVGENYPHPAEAVSSSATGSFARGAAMGVIPAAGGLAGAAPGAALGAEIGLLGGPFAPITVPVGSFIGALGGSMLGSYAAAKTQDVAISAMPSAWKDPLERQLAADHQQHSDASYIGGWLPFIVTMKPGAWKGAGLTENASFAMRVAKNPLTAHLFGGAVMGGTELGQEWVSGQSADWGKVAISTGVGLVFNKPNQLGEKITAFGVHPFGLGAKPRAAVVEQPAPTLADAQDMKTGGPAINEGVFNGTEQMDPEAEKAAYALKSAELDAMGAPQPEPDIHAIARQMHPELFDAYDRLSAQRDELRRWIAETNNPPQEKFDALDARKAELEAQLAETKNKTDQRRIRTQLRVDVQGEIDKLNARKEAFAQGEAADTPELAAARQHFLAIDGQMRDLAPDVSAAYRRASERGMSETAEAEPIPNEAEPQDAAIAPEAPQSAANETPAERPTLVETAAQPRSLAEQKASIADDVKRQLIAVGVPADQAESRAQLEASFFATLSARAQGKFGTAAELYAKHGAIWKRGGKASRAAMLAAAPRPIAPLPPPAPPELVAPAKIEGRPLPVAASPAPRVIESPVAEQANERIKDLTPTEVAAQVPAFSTQAADALPKPENANDPAGIMMFDPTALNVDAHRFQFKTGGDQYGVTGALRSVSKWDRSKAQAIMVWQDLSGKLFVADGHQRSGLARRLTEQGKASGVQLPGLLYREADGIDADHMRAIAAVTNIANGSGSALDGAKVLRSHPDMLDGSLPLSEGKGKQSANLAHLDDEAFRMVINDVVPEHQGAIVGELIPRDGARQIAAMKAIARFEPKNAEETTALVQRVAQAELAKAEEGRQISMFGDLETEDSTAGEEMKIVGRAIKDLKKDKTLFARVIANAERIEQTGSHIERGTAQDVARDAEVFARTLASDAYTAGPVRTEIIAAARELKNGKIQIGEASTRILDALRRQVDERGSGGDRGGAGMGQAEEGSAQESKNLELAQNLPSAHVRGVGEAGFELGAEGKPQQLIPGVDPVTDKDRLNAAANAPMRGGNADLQHDGLFGDGQNQQDLFQKTLGKIRLSIPPGKKPFITLFDKSNFSTLIHEGAHNYLDILSQYADHPDAPDGLKSDWATVKDWLGNDGSDDFKTQHEKFARGFEQYIREGVAPSTELAGAFARFRNWMVSIYQSLKGLGKPINDDIRGIFDRMLAEHPQRTVIAPERAAAGPTLADIHEADANETEPHEAEAAMARVQSERDRYVAEPPQEIAHEIAPEIAKAEAVASERGAAPGKDDGSESVGRASGSGEVDGSGLGGGAKPASGGMGAGGGKVERGGAEAGAEGAGVSGQQQRPDGSGSNGPALEPRPRPVYGPAESGSVDKVGNIRIANLTDQKSVIQALKDSGDRNNDFEAVRGGRVTKGMLSDLADDCGLTANTLTEKKLAAMFGDIDKLPERVLAVRRVIVESGQLVHDAAKRNAAEKTNESRAAFAQAIMRHDLIQSTLSGVTASWGRTGNAFHNLMEGWDNAQTFNQILKENTGRDLNQLDTLSDLVSSYDTPEQVSKIVKDSRDKGFGRMILEYWINGLISGPATHTTYVLGNMLLSLVKAVPETAAAAGIGAVRSAFGREGERVHIGEVGAQLSAALQSLPSALTSAADAGRTGASTLLPGETPHSAPKAFGMASTLAAPTKIDATYHDAMGAAMGLLRGARDGFISAGAMDKMGPDAKMFGLNYSGQGATPDVRIGNANIPTGNLVRMPARGVGVIHSFFRVSNYAMELAAESYRQAAGEGREGSALTQRMEQLRANPTPKMMENCRTIATELALMGPGGDLTKNISKLFNTSVNLPLLRDTQILKFIDPFVQISSNIIDQSLGQRTPLGLLFSPELRADIAGKNGNIAQDKAQAKMLVGSLLAITFGGLASQGLVTGAGPSDREEARVWQQAGYQPHSVRIGDMWYDVHRLGPIGTLLGMSADLYGVAGKIGEDDYAGAAAHLHHAIVQNILDESFMRGPAELIKAIEDPGRFGDAYVRNFLSSFVPYSVGMGQIARAQDPYSRQARTVIDAIRAKIPGMSQDLLPRRDMWGEPMPSLDALGAKGLTAIYMKKISTDPVNLAMMQLGVTNAPPHRTIRNVELTDLQYDDYSRLAGRIAKANLDRVVPSQQFQTYPPAVKRDLILTVIKKGRESAAGMMLAKYPQIFRQATEDKIQHKRGDDISPIN